jgi:hypothetical protein
LTVFGASSRARPTLKNSTSVSLGRCALDGAYRLATALECATERAEAQQRQVTKYRATPTSPPAEHLTSV